MIDRFPTIRRSLGDITERQQSFIIIMKGCISVWMSHRESSLGACLSEDYARVQMQKTPRRCATLKGEQAIVIVISRETVYTNNYMLKK
jgi:hypothetical protein